MTQNMTKSWERFQCSNWGKICSHFIRKFCFAIVQIIWNKKSHLRVFQLFFKIDGDWCFLVGPKYIALCTLFLSLLNWGNFLFLSLFKNLNIAFFIICFTFSRRFKIAPCRSKGPNIFLNLYATLKNLKWAKLLLMNKNINSYVP